MSFHSATWSKGLPPAHRVKLLVVLLSEVSAAQLTRTSAGNDGRRSA